VLASLYDFPQELKQLFEKPIIFVKVRSYNNIIEFTSVGASLTENVRIDEQLKNAREDV
jgi:hypothetical protein